MSAASEYAELLKLIEVSGPFVSLPVFKEVFPQGFAKDAPDQTRELRELYDDWREARAQAPSLVTPAQREWLRAVFVNWLGWPAEWLAEDNAIPQNLTHFVAQHHETLRPDAVLLEDGKPRLLLAWVPPAQQPDRRPPGSTWNATHATRMAELLHAKRIPLGLVTNGERFTLVYAEPEQPTGFADFHAELWFDERLTLRAFRDFLSASALFSRPPEQTLDALYRRSLENQQEVSTTLGRQVRRAVEMFVAALDRADREGGRSLLQGLPEEHIYEAALTLMMRLVFLFFAEERDLLPITNPVYRENYAVTTLHDQLREAANRLGEEVLERRYDAFPRLLAIFRAVHGGIEHDLAALPAYGGDLFDPDRFAFLEGRAPGSVWQATTSQPFPVHNRTVLHLLEALQFLEMKVPGGGRETRRLSFRALDIEQIGHVYEGLLDHTARRAEEIVLGLEGKEEPEIALSELNRRREQSDFVEWLAGQTGRTARTIDKALSETAVDDPLRWPEWERVAPYAGLVRRDENGDPWVIPSGSVYVTTGTDRRQTGTQYTPRSLTESVVEHALAPLVYIGPAEGHPPDDWQLKPAGQILDLRVCDFACGSAAFLVAAARYISSRLVEAWEVAQREHGIDVQITPYGHPSSGLPEEELIPANPDERSLYGLRIVVERCLYGVDRNPLAVEMAKLSLWLLTLQRNRPFTFLDHAIRCGDSLLGVGLKQLSTWSLSGEGKQSVLFDDDLSFAADKREGLMKLQYRPGDQRRLLEAALAKTRRLRAAADRLIATAFEANPEAAAAAVAMGLEEQEIEARKILEGKRPFHWPVELPEVFLRDGGFDAIIGNPPFLHGSRISSVHGGDYQKFLQAANNEVSGKADLVVHFLRRAATLVRPDGYVGLVMTSKVREGDARISGFVYLVTAGFTILRTVPEMQWPGDASVRVCVAHLRRGHWAGTLTVDNKPAPAINSRLEAELETAPIHHLRCMEEKVYLGAKPDSLGFVLTLDRTRILLEDEKNSSVIRPYFSGADLNESPELRPNRYIIDFSELDLNDARHFPELLAIVERDVRPGRMELKRKAYRDRWWQFTEPQLALFRGIRALERTLAVSRVSKYFAFQFVPTGAVYSDKVVVFISDRWEDFTILNSTLHECWALRYGATHGDGGTPNYKPSECGATYPLPASDSSISPIGECYDRHRHATMVARREGLTAIYNRVHSPHEVSEDVVKLRALHVELDHTVAAAYGWSDLDLVHDFRNTRQGIRYTISEAARREVLERLLALNHERYAQEQAAVSEQPRSKRKPRTNPPAQPGLF